MMACPWWSAELARRYKKAFPAPAAGRVPPVQEKPPPAPTPRRERVVSKQ